MIDISQKRSDDKRTSGRQGAGDGSRQRLIREERVFAAVGATMVAAVDRATFLGNLEGLLSCRCVQHRTMYSGI